MTAMECSLDRLEQVVKFNSVWIVQQQARGLYYHMCLLNHSCFGNVNIVQVGNVVVVRAVRRIAKGEEFNWNYKTSECSWATEHVGVVGDCLVPNARFG